MGRAGTRSDQTHLSAEHVEELRQFIQPRSSKNATSSNNAGIARCVQFCHRTIGLDKPLQMMLMAAGINVDLHGSELDHHEASPTVANAFLPIENGPRGGGLNP